MRYKFLNLIKKNMTNSLVGLAACLTGFQFVKIPLFLFLRRKLFKYFRALASKINQQLPL